MHKVTTAQTLKAAIACLCDITATLICYRERSGRSRNFGLATRLRFRASISPERLHVRRLPDRDSAIVLRGVHGRAPAPQRAVSVPSEDEILHRIRDGLLSAASGVSAAEATWIVRRLAELLHWRCPDFADASAG